MSDYEIGKNKVGLKIRASIIEDEAKKQIDLILSHPAIKDLVSIMPDVHAGNGCIVGFTGKFKDGVIPSIVGFDLGCGVFCYKLKTREIDFAKLDDYIRKNIPIGFSSRSNDWISITSFFDLSGMPLNIRQEIYSVTTKAQKFLEDNNILGKTLPSQQIGTLGGGNHFIEVDKSDNGDLYLVIHSGSRNFGLKVGHFYQNMAKNITRQMNIIVPKDMEYLPMDFGGREYLEMAKLAQDYAHLNRLSMLYVILQFLKEEYEDSNVIESVHNYISNKDGIIRKGAISAHTREKLVVPLNMGAGIIIGTGKGNKDYNWSAPHGAGRLYGRKEMLRKLDSGIFHSMDDFKNSMEGIFTTSVNRSTFDESQFAYKPWDSISTYLEETVDIVVTAKSVYNLKASETNEK